MVGADSEPTPPPVITAPPPAPTIPPPVGNTLQAEDDTFFVPAGSHLLSVAQNDQRADATDQVRISEVGEPSSGTVQIDGDQIQISIVDASSPITFTYTITDGSSTSQATATVVVLGTGTATTAEFTELQLGLADSADGGDDANSGVFPRFRVPPALLAILSLDLAQISLLWVVAGLIFPAILLLRARSDSGWVAVTGVDRDETVTVKLKFGELQLRHDARDIWRTGRKRRGLVQVETFGGTGWMKPDHLQSQS